MNVNEVPPVNAEPQTEEAHGPSGFAAGTYIKRTREVLAGQLKEASKVQADTRTALLEVWRDLRTDIRGQISTFEASAKRRAESLRDQLPIIGRKAKADDTNGEANA